RLTFPIYTTPPPSFVSLSLVFLNDRATPEIHTLSLHDALPIYASRPNPKVTSTISSAMTAVVRALPRITAESAAAGGPGPALGRSEEHTSELQSLTNLVCRLLLEKKNLTPTAGNTQTPQASQHP